MVTGEAVTAGAARQNIPRFHRGLLAASALMVRGVFAPEQQSTSFRGEILGGPVCDRPGGFVLGQETAPQGRAMVDGVRRETTAWAFEEPPERRPLSNSYPLLYRCASGDGRDDCGFVPSQYEVLYLSMALETGGRTKK